MIRATVNQGITVPRDPLPEDWHEGTEVAVEKSPQPAPVANGIHPADAWMDEVEAIAAQGDPEDDKRLQAALQSVRGRP